MIESKTSTAARKQPAPPAAAAPAAETTSVTEEQEIAVKVPAAEPVAKATPEGAEEVPAAEPTTIEPFTLPDVIGAPVATSEDAVRAVLSKSHSIAHAGAAPSGYGVTRSRVSVTGTTVTHTPTPTSTFTVRATLKNTITWQVRTGAGPGSQKHLGSAASPLLTAANYTTAVSDLTPDMSDLNGRPPRTKFWARDLTERHEKFHTGDHKTEGEASTGKVATWLGTKTAANKADVSALVGQVPAKWNGFFFTTRSSLSMEHRAYGDGAPSYTARAAAIKARGVAGKYP